MDKMAVKPLEEEIDNIDGIKDLTTVINPGRFTIVLELEKGVDKYNTADKVKDALAIAKIQAKLIMQLGDQKFVIILQAPNLQIHPINGLAESQGILL